jgi:nucleoside 2-deoxyribosyltransferase
MIYLIGSLRNPEVPIIAEKLRAEGYEVFDDWYAAGEFADSAWQAYEIAREHDLKTALAGYASQHVFQYDRSHLDRCSAAVLVLPAGRSGHLELGYVLGQGKPGFILLNEELPRWDVMYAFAQVATSLTDLFNQLDDRGVDYE